MKTILRTVFGVCLSVTFLAAGTTEGMRVTLTKAADIAGTALPAGTYVVRNMSSGSTPVIQFRSEKGVIASVIMESLGVRRGETKLVMKEVDNKLEVEQIWFGDEGGFEIIPQATK